MSKRYLEIYSSHRDRTQYPLPSTFVVPFGQTTSSVKDPILTGSIYYQWSTVNQLNINGVLYPLYDFGTIIGGTNGVAIIQSLVGNIQTVRDAYKGYTVVYSPPAGQGSGDTRKILSYDPPTSSITPQIGFGINPTGSTYYIIGAYNANPSSFSIPSQDGFGNSIVDRVQAYINYYLMDETASNGSSIIAQPISYYDNNLRLAYTASPLTGWKPTDSMSIRKGLPLEKWTLDTLTRINLDPSYGPVGPVITLPVGASSIDQYYRGKYVYFSSNGPTSLFYYTTLLAAIYGIFYIKSYKAATRELFVEYSQNGVPLPYTVVNQGTILGGSSTTALLLSNLSETTSSYFTNYYITNTVQNATSQIVGFGYDTVADYAAIVSPAFAVAPTAGDTYTITSLNTINIVSQLEDNAATLDYIGTMVSVNQAVCYDVELIELILPNIPLLDGPIVAFYPYVYVELKNVSSPDGAASSTIYSNNPPSNRAFFIVLITDISQPTTSTFVKLSCSTTSRIKFKPNDSLQFSVTLPNGDYVSPVYPDNFSPYPPNPDLQIHATFGLKQV